MSAESMLDGLLAKVDGVTAGASRWLANQTSRRSMLGRTGAVLAGMGAFPMLPVYREALGAAEIPELGDPNTCEYWRYCAFSGTSHGSAPATIPRTGRTT